MQQSLLIHRTGRFSFGFYSVMDVILWDGETGESSGKGSGFLLTRRKGSVSFEVSRQSLAGERWEKKGTVDSLICGIISLENFYAVTSVVQMHCTITILSRSK